MPKRKQKIEPWQVRDKRKRSKQTLPPRKRYLICTEGKSEAIYFDHYKSSTGPVVIPLDKSDHKVSLVKKTIGEMNIRIQTGEFDKKIDEVWVVLDRDANPLNRFDKSHFNQALDLAGKNGVFVAYSNDAFELWFILHYQDLWASTHRDQLFNWSIVVLCKKSADISRVCFAFFPLIEFEINFYPIITISKFLHEHELYADRNKYKTLIIFFKFKIVSWQHIFDPVIEYWSCIRNFNYFESSVK